MRRMKTVDCPRRKWPGSEKISNPLVDLALTRLEVTEPNLAEKGMHFILALTRWAMAGFPTRSAEEVKRLFAICQKCDHFDGQSCTICGCNVSGRRGLFIRNKAVMATEYCPHSEGDKWQD